MTQENINILGNVFNALGNISTKGEDTLLMADCLRVLQQLLSDLTQENNTETENEEV